MFSQVFVCPRGDGLPTGGRGLPTRRRVSATGGGIVGKKNPDPEK